MIVYHGSDKKIESPIYGYGRDDNDYGSGFYTTEDVERARQWAVANGSALSVCNKYQLDMSGLDVLRLDDCGTLTWIAEVIYHRGVNDTQISYIARAICEKYKLDTSSYDIIIGYRADDSYTKVVDAFLYNNINIDEVERFFKKGELGQQIFIKSEKAFEQLEFIESEVVTDKKKYEGYDVEARRYVERFLDERSRQIQLDGYEPIGITARVAIQKRFAYDKKVGYFIPFYARDKNKYLYKDNNKSMRRTRR